MTPGPSPRGPAAPAPPPASPETLARDAAGLAARLSELLIKETALLRGGRPADIVGLQAAKAELAGQFSAAFQQLRGTAAGLAALPALLRQTLRRQVEQLSLVAGENEKALRLMQNATDRVLGIIARAVREQRAAGAGYARDSKRPRRLPGTCGMNLDRKF